MLVIYDDLRVIIVNQCLYCKIQLLNAYSLLKIIRVLNIDF